MKSIEIIVSPTGQSTIQTKGFAGASCRGASRPIEQALGTVQSDTPTVEMYQTVQADQQISQSSGGGRGGS